METCKHCIREIIDSIPVESGSIHCCGCHKKIYGLWDEDCKQVILRENYDN